MWNDTQAKHTLQLHYAPWDEVCTPKSRGGLGIKNLNLWRRVIHGKVAARVKDSDGYFLSKIMIFKMMGNGISTLTKDENWLGSLPLRLWPTFVNYSILPEHVSSLLGSNGEWSTDISNLFGEQLVNTILNLPREDATGIDRLVWTQMETKDMLAAAVYEIESSPSDLSGGGIWKANSQPRMLLHLWRALSNMLPTYNWLHFHKLRDSDRCP